MSGGQHKHTPLTHGKNIRLLRIDPFESETPIVNIFEVSLANTPTYNALSYTWGAPQSDCYIICNGNPLTVTPNCRAALLRLRRNPDYLTLWVDAICIDQTTDSEKSVQVPLMGEIYSRAVKVLIWLGEESLESNLALNHLRAAAALAAHAPKDEVKYKNLEDEFTSSCKELYHGRSGTVNTNPIKEILGRAWFSRVWTYQEAVLARSATIFCGDAELSWQEMESALYYLSDHENKHSRSVWTNYSVLRKDLIAYRLGKMLLHEVVSRSSTRSPESWTGKFRKGWSRFVHASDESQVDFTNNSFHDFLTTEDSDKIIRSVSSTMTPRCSFALFSMRPREVTNLRDKVYGIYGLLQKQGIMNLPPVDYKGSVEDIYTAMTRFSIEHDRSLFVLAAVLSTERLPDLPSWVPDWSNNLPAIPMSGTGFAAAKTSTAQFSFDRLSRLTLYGVVIDEILAVPQHSTLTAYDMKDKTFVTEDKSTANLLSAIQIVSAFQEWIKLARTFQSYPTGEPIEDVLCRTLLCNGRGIMEEELEESSVMFRSFREWMVIIIANDPEKGVGIPFVCSVMETWKSTNVVKEYYERDLGLDTNPQTAPEEVTITRAIQSCDASHFHELAGNYSAQRIFSTTKNGRYALAPLKAQPRDLVVLLSGLNVPYLIRREGPTWKLLGAAYVHGVMQGEVWPGNNSPLNSFNFS